ncbi:hypothetical protein TrVFT333_007125 [Trichoderma virens FT-333]|nr:hypothetical protein TrVFT333_007125 [Trichoderma virens FT-333]
MVMTTVAPKRGVSLQTADGYVEPPSGKPELGPAHARRFLIITDGTVSFPKTTLLCNASPLFITTHAVGLNSESYLIAEVFRIESFAPSLPATAAHTVDP